MTDGSTPTFYQTGTPLARQQGWRTEDPERLLAQWDEFVRGCEDGDEYDISEYNDEISVREELPYLT